jgi:transposase
MEETPSLQRIKDIIGCAPPWYIRRFSASFEPHKVHVWLDHGPVGWPCPTCQRTLACGGHARERVFLCLSCHEPEAHVYIRVPYVACPHHGIQEVEVPWMLDRSRWRFVKQTMAAASSEDTTIH